VGGTYENQLHWRWAIGGGIFLSMSHWPHDVEVRWQIYLDLLGWRPFSKRVTVLKNVVSDVGGHVTVLTVGYRGGKCL